MNMVFKPISEIEIKEMRIGTTPMEDIIAEQKIIARVSKVKETTLTFDSENTPPCFQDNDGFVYDYDLFILGEILRPGFADNFYRTRLGYYQDD